MLDMITMMFVVHISAILWYLFYDFNRTNSNWLTNYFDNQGYVEENSFGIYLICMYFVITTFSTVGYGDIYPVT